MNIMEVRSMKNEEWLILNAIKAWLYQYPTEVELRPQYEKLNEKQHNAYIKQDEVRKRGRPAKRQRKKETASVASSKEAVESTEA